MAARGEGVAEEQCTSAPRNLPKGTRMLMDPKVSCGRVWAPVPAAWLRDTVCLPPVDFTPAVRCPPLAVRHQVVALRWAILPETRWSCAALARQRGHSC